MKDNTENKMEQVKGLDTLTEKIKVQCRGLNHYRYSPGSIHPFSANKW